MYSSPVALNTLGRAFKERSTASQTTAPKNHADTRKNCGRSPLPSASNLPHMALTSSSDSAWRLKLAAFLLFDLSLPMFFVSTFNAVTRFRWGLCQDKNRFVLFFFLPIIFNRSDATYKFSRFLPDLGGPGFVHKQGGEEGDKAVGRVDRSKEARHPAA